MTVSTNSREAHQYDSLFYRYQREGSARSAAALLAETLKVLPVESVLDVGCGAGAWLAAYRALGIEDCMGIDGEYVDRSTLMVDESRFSPVDISKPFNVGRRFDIVQCLEVAEHVPHSASSTLLDNLVRHGDKILFSAAVPGQGGENHVNEQPYGFWRDLFAARGYCLFDFVRPRVRGNAAIEPWYRYNTLFFAHESTLGTLPAEVLNARVGAGQAIADFSPMSYRVRKALLRAMPQEAVSKLAVWKHRKIVKAHQLR